MTTKAQQHDPTPEDLFRVEWDLDTFEKGGERFIGGFISSSRKDKHGERVLQKGLDFSYFKNNGFFNDNHDKTTGGIVGEPTAVDFRPNPSLGGQKAWYAEGRLYKTKRADEIWDLAKALEKAGSNRRLGFSLQGKIKKRADDPTKIEKAFVRHCAITGSPVNNDTRMEILRKSVEDLFVDSDDVTDDFERALGTGTATDSAGVTDGDALKTESLEGDGKNVYTFGDEESEGEQDEADGDVKKSMSVGQALDRVMVLRKGIDAHVALDMVLRLEQR